MNARELELLETRIANAEKEKANAEGALEQLMGRLKEEFGCSTIAEAEEEIRRLEGQITKRSAKLEQLTEELRLQMEDPRE